MTTDLVDLPPRFGMDRPAFDKIGSRAGGRAAARGVGGARAGRGRRPGVEVFLLERAAEMAFAAGMSVFPGGGLDAADQEALAEGLVDADAAEDAARSWDTAPDAAAALIACAVRETYEETGVLLGGAAPPAAGTRERLVAREIGLREVVGHVDAAALRPWARWVTPEGMPRRYDTAFFVAGVPDGQEPDGATTEAVGAGWCAPAQALHEWEDGVRALMPPTWAVLSELAAADSAAGLARRRRGATPGARDPELPARRRARRARRPVARVRGGPVSGRLVPGPADAAPAHPAYGLLRPVTQAAAVVLAENPSPMTLDGTNTWILRAPGAGRLSSSSTPARRTRRTSTGSRPAGPSSSWC